MIKKKEKKEPLAKALQNVFQGTLYKASDAYWHTDFLSTLIPAVDNALGGGFGYGRVSEIFGDWSAGKTLLLYYALIGNQKAGGTSILFESEGAFTPSFFEALGGNPKKLLLYSADTVEDVFDGFMAICRLMSSRTDDDTPIAVGWDSIGATDTKHSQDTKMEKRDMSKPGQMSRGTRKVTNAIKKCRIALIATNQTRDEIREDRRAGGLPHTPGGKAWPFHSSQRVLLEYDGSEEGSMILCRDETYKIGRMVKGTTVKNKLASPFGEFLLPIYVKEGFKHPIFDEETKTGIHIDESTFYMYTKGHYLRPDKDLVVKAGSWCSLHEEFNHGNFRRREWPSVLEKHPELRTLIYDTRDGAEGNTGGVSKTD
jgi:RecA/RadA recombinase